MKAIQNRHIDSREVMIFLQDILDAIFQILMEDSMDLNGYNLSILLTLCTIIQMLQNDKYRYFRTVLETYLDHFSQTLVSMKLLTIMCDTLEFQKSDQKEASNDTKSVLK